MLGNLDAVTGDALRSFHDALNHAQQALQRDQQRLSETTELVRALTEEVDALQAASAPNSAARLRCEALESEQAKMTHQARHQRESITTLAQHIERLQEPRRKVQERVAALREEVKRLRRQYGVRAAQVHTYVAQFLQPQNSLDSLRQQLAQLQQRRLAGEDALEAAKAALTAQQEELESLRVVGPADVTKGHGAAEAMEPQDADAARGEWGHSAAYHTAQNRNEEASSPGSCLAAATAHCQPRTDAEERAELLQRRAQQEAHHRATAEQESAERAALESMRAELKRQVLHLCQAIEAADVAQQQEQKSYHDALNEAETEATSRGGSAGVQCQHCHGDLLAGFA